MPLNAPQPQSGVICLVPNTSLARSLALSQVVGTDGLQGVNQHEGVNQEGVSPGPRRSRTYLYYSRSVREAEAEEEVVVVEEVVVM